MADLVRVAERLRRRTRVLRFGRPVACVYAPLDYAWKPHRRYLERYGLGPREVLFVGMNPGPFGMAQTGVPFGDVELVRDWLGIEAPVGRPKHEHPRRPVLGFDSGRREVSGARFWGWARERFRTPDAFFRRAFVWNYCPLCFMEEGGRNLTPDRLRPREARERLFAICDEALAAVAAHLRPSAIVGIGRFAGDRARPVAERCGARCGSAPHPSPASPRANRGWNAIFEAALRDLGIGWAGDAAAGGPGSGSA
ncbi:MAG: single-stranded DNA-binding protein [Acidobacteria bacterium]|nr:single-stranded DNA-binding protein [Acidobacteriota bacterium]